MISGHAFPLRGIIRREEGARHRAAIFRGSPRAGGRCGSMLKTQREGVQETRLTQVRRTNLCLESCGGLRVVVCLPDTVIVLSVPIRDVQLLGTAGVCSANLEKVKCLVRDCAGGIVKHGNRTVLAELSWGFK